MTTRQKLRLIQKLSGLTQTELAGKLDVSFVSINRWIKKRATPRRKAVEKIDQLYRTYAETRKSPVGLTWVAATSTPTKTYVTRVINLGTWEEWKDLQKSVPKTVILDALEHPLIGQWTPRGKAFAECVFDRILSHSVLISYA